MCGEERNHGVGPAQFNLHPNASLMASVFCLFLTVSPPSGRHTSRFHLRAEPLHFHDLRGLDPRGYVPRMMNGVFPLLMGFWNSI